LKGGTGSNTRTSKTVGVDFLYVAAPAKGGGAVRLAYPLAVLHQSTAVIRKNVLWASVISCVLAMILAALMARSSTRRIENMAAFAGRIADRDFGGALRDPSRDELGLLARRSIEPRPCCRRAFRAGAQPNPTADAARQHARGGDRNLR